MNRPLLGSTTPVDLSNCDLEPIHIPSLIQPHGMLLAARSSDLRIVYTSENSPAFLGVTPSFILERTLLELLGVEAVASIEEALGPEQYLPKNILTFTFPLCGSTRFDVTAHRTNGLLCVEIELAGEEPRWDLLSSRLEDAMRVLGAPRTLKDLFAKIPRVLRKLTGYERVMVYRFDTDGHGEIVAEEKAEDMEPFFGLHYPATDIPRQARQLFLLQRVRTIVEVNYVPVSVQGNRDLIHDEPLDMTYCSLRSSSPIHIEYLQNMGVGASLAISLIHDGELWGMVVGHHRTRKHLPPESRALCDLLGQLISLLIGSAQQADNSSLYLEKKALLDELSISVKDDLTVDSGFAQSTDALLALVGADGILVRIGDQMSLLGRTPALAEAASLMSALLLRLKQEALASDQLRAILPAFSHLTQIASGVLLVPLHEPNDGIVWLRGEVTQTVRWAGKPDASKLYVEGSVRLSPRKSFALWEEVQRGRSLPWQPGEIDAALALRRLAVKALLQRSETQSMRFRHTDSLTGLPNRLALMDQIAKWQDQASGSPASLLFLDLDGFKAINDRFGHTVGDEFLKQVAQRLRSLTKQFIARLGGDEFVLFCEHTNIHQAKTLADLILISLAEPLLVKGIPLRAATSIGIAPVGKVSDTNTDDPLRVADSAMSVAKHKGGNQFSIVESREQAEILRLTIEEEVLARRRAAEELATSYARLNSVLESTSDNVMTISRDWILLYANRRAMESLPDLKIGANYWSCFPALLGTPAEQHQRDAMLKRIEQHYELFYSPYGRWYRVKAFPVDDGITLFFSDVTQEKSTQDQLSLEQLLREKRIEALSHMAGGLAHEISNPLAIIHGRASDLKMLADEEAPVASLDVRIACDSIIKTSNRATNILRGLRGFAHEGAQDPMEPASIYDIIDQCVELQQSRFDRYNIQFKLVVDRGIPPLVCREVQIGQILTNLLVNAFDAVTQSDSTDRWITLAAQSSEGQISIYVTDSGPGIEDHFRAHLMEPFFTTKELGLGMGVGLSLSRAIAQDHGGTLTLLDDSKHTCFRLTLPMTPNASSGKTQLAVEGVPTQS